MANRPELWRHALPAPSLHAHKYMHGHCLVLSGPALATGASRLSARAALNAGAGAVTIAGKRDALFVHAAHVTSIMLREAGTPESFEALLAEGRFQSLVIGPAAGVGGETLACLKAAAGSGIPTVADADALTSLAQEPQLLPHHPAAAGALVLTPHAGEFARLFPDLALPGEADDRARTAAAFEAAQRSQAVLVLKGRRTVIAAPDARVAINENAGLELATAGSGDVLAGLIAAHLAQGMPAFEAAAAGVWLHAEAGAMFGLGLTADRLVDLIRPVRWFMNRIA